MKRFIRFLLNSINIFLIAIVLLIYSIACLIVSPFVIILMFLDITFTSISDWAYFDIPLKNSIKDTYGKWMK